MKFLARIEADNIKVNRLKKGNRSMVSVYSKLYRVDNHLMVKDSRSDQCIVIYPADDTQPLLPEPILVDPDMTCALIDSAKNNGSKKSVWANLTGSNLMSYLTVVIVVGALLYGFLVGGGF